MTHEIRNFTTVPSNFSRSFVRKTVIWAHIIQYNFIGYVRGNVSYIRFNLIVKQYINVHFISRSTIQDLRKTMNFLGLFSLISFANAKFNNLKWYKRFHHNHVYQKTFKRFFDSAIEIKSEKIDKNFGNFWQHFETDENNYGPIPTLNYWNIL